MSRPKCYVESPIGFTPMTAKLYDELLERLRDEAGIDPINPFFIAGGKHIPGILKATGEERQRRWRNMARELYDVIRFEADMGLAILNGEPADFGVGCEMGYGLALADVGYKPFPLVAYREDYRRSGETDNNLNGMALPPYMDTGGVFVDEYEKIFGAVAGIAARFKPVDPHSLSAEQRKTIACANRLRIDPQQVSRVELVTDGGGHFEAVEATVRFSTGRDVESWVEESLPKLQIS